MTMFSTPDISQSLATLSSAKNAQAQAGFKVKGQAKAAAQQFEAMFLNTMFQNMSAGINGDGPFGGSGALKIWRSMLTDEYAKSFAKTGGIGIASHIYDMLLKQQGVKSDEANSNGG
jgi:peptidoglycan hydrolase FlgJ